VALVTDGRFSGATRGLMVGHVAPEAAVGGPLAKLRDGDEIEIDVDRRTVRAVDVDLSGRDAIQSPKPTPPLGAYRKYVQTVGSASTGAVTTARRQERKE